MPRSPASLPTWGLDAVARSIDSCVAGHHPQPPIDGCPSARRKKRELSCAEQQNRGRKERCSQVTLMCRYSLLRAGSCPSQGINFAFQAGRSGVKPAGARMCETLQDRPVGQTAGTGYSIRRWRTTWTARRLHTGTSVRCWRAAPKTQRRNLECLPRGQRQDEDEGPEFG